MRKVLVVAVVGLLIGVLLGWCSAATATEDVVTGDVKLVDVVDTERTNPQLYQEYDLPDGFVLQSVAVIGVVEVLDGMVSAAGGHLGTQVWHYHGALGEFYVYIWGIDSATGGFSLINCDKMMTDSIISQMEWGHAASTYDIADMVKGLKEQGFERIQNPQTDLPTRASEDYIRHMLDNLPATLPIWRVLSNVMIFVFPETMIWFGPIEGGES